MPTGHASLMPALRRVVLAGASADRTDGQLLGAFLADRDADAFGLLVRRHGPMVLGVCRRIIGDFAIAEDAFQAVFLVLARRAATVKPREQVGNWLYGVAYRTALKARAVLARRRSREKQVDVMPEPPVSASPDAWSDLQPVIDEELARLPEKLRGPVVLCDIEGRPQREVAKQLGVPPATLATRLATARRTLAQRLTKRGITLSGGVVAGLLTAHGAAKAVPPALTHGLTRAAEAVATGSALSPLVSASAVQLSEGVMRMMLLTKLKAVAVTVLTFVTLTGGLGLGLVPAKAGSDEPGQTPAATPAAKPAANTVLDAKVAEKLKNLTLKANESIDDATFLRRTMLDLRGTLPTDIESFFFIADPDANKRVKVIEWILADSDVKAYAAKVLGMPAERIKTVRVAEANDGKTRGIVVVVDASAEAQRIQALAFSPDFNEHHVEVHNSKPQVTVNRVVTEKQVELVADPKNAIPADSRFHSVQLRVAGTDEKGNALWVHPDGTIGPKPRVIVIAQHDKPLAGQQGTIHLWDKATGNAQVQVGDDGKQNTFWVEVGANAESDLDFLKRATMAARGTGPTALETKYYTEDKDPKKREKVLDALLKEPAVAKKLGDDFKKKMLAGSGPNATPGHGEFKLFIIPDGKQGQHGKVLPFDPKNMEWNFDLNFGPKQFKIEPMPQPKKVEPKKDGGTFEFRLDPQPIDPQPKKGGTLEFRIEPQPQPQPKKSEPKKEGTFEFKFEPGTFQFEWPVDPKTGRLGGPIAPPKPKAPATPAAPHADKLGKLIDALLAAKKTDAEMLEALTLATGSRLPTDTEKRLTLGLVSKAADRKAAWLEVAKALSGPVAGSGAKQVELHLELPHNFVIPVPPAKP